jgi:RNA polymerase sigma factor (sigma-70 family)
LSDDHRKEKPLHVVPRPVDPPADETSRRVAFLFERHHDRVFRAAYRITGDASDAEDVLQTIFLRLLRQGDDLEIGETDASYFHRAAVNAGLDLLRKRKVARARPLEEAATTRDPGPGPETAHAGREGGRRLREALAELPPRAAEMFTLRYLEGYGNREIAAMLGTSFSTVAVTLFRTRNRLRSILAGELP